MVKLQLSGDRQLLKYLKDSGSCKDFQVTDFASTGASFDTFSQAKGRSKTFCELMFVKAQNAELARFLISNMLTLDDIHGNMLGVCVYLNIGIYWASCYMIAKKKKQVTASCFLLLMEEILHHLGWLKPYK